ALNHGSAATVTLLFYLYPVWVMLTAIVLDRRIPAGRLVTALAMAIVGSAVVVVGGSGVEIAPIGIALAILCSLTYTGYLTAADRDLDGGRWRVDPRRGGRRDPRSRCARGRAGCLRPR